MFKYNWKIVKTRYIEECLNIMLVHQNYYTVFNQFLSVGLH